MKLPIYLLSILNLFLWSCEAPTGGTMSTPIEYQNNPEAQAAAARLTSGGITFPSAASIDREINGHGLTERLHTPTCESCGLEVTTGEEFTATPGQYDLVRLAREINHPLTPNDRDYEEDAGRLSLVQQLRAAGSERHARTTLDLPGGRFEVFNDALTLPDGTYVNLTLRESLDIAAEWGCRLPNRDQAQAIRRYAEEQDSVFSGRTHFPNDAADRYSNMNAMMNDSEMRSRAEIGRERLINGHFKWYLDDGSNGQNFSFYGFRACSPYCQGGSSGGHGADYIDYSQSARLICPAS